MRHRSLTNQDKQGGGLADWMWDCQAGRQADRLWIPQKDRQASFDGHRQTDCEAGRQTGCEPGTHWQNQADRLWVKWTNCQADRLHGSQVGRQACTHTSSWQADRQTNGPTVRQTDTHHTNWVNQQYRSAWDAGRQVYKHACRCPADITNIDVPMNDEEYSTRKHNFQL